MYGETGVARDAYSRAHAAEVVYPGVSRGAAICMVHRRRVISDRRSEDWGKEMITSRYVEITDSPARARKFAQSGDSTTRVVTSARTIIDDARARANRRSSKDLIRTYTATQLCQIMDVESPLPLDGFHYTHGRDFPKMRRSDFEQSSRSRIKRTEGKMYIFNYKSTTIEL